MFIQNIKRPTSMCNLVFLSPGIISAKLKGVYYQYFFVVYTDKQLKERKKWSLFPLNNITKKSQRTVE